MSAARRPAPHARERGAARGAAEALTPPAPSAARTGGARGRGRRSSPSRLQGRRGSRASRQADVGRGYERAGAGPRSGAGGKNLKAAARSRITAAPDRGQQNKFQKSSSLLPSLPKSSGSGSGARRVAEGYVAALPRARVRARARAPNSWHAEERGRGWEL